MIEFWITFGFFGLMAIPAMIMFIVCGADAENKISGALITLGIWLFLSFGFWADAKVNADRWNGGYCDCGQHWELRGASKSRTGNETKYYACPDCYTEIKLN